MMHRIIGTAGHIDHGKTSLVKALTGQDTDRLKEEKERGISIELGFARLDLPDGTRAGVVDVPGHERFVRTMLAGAHGIDVVLFTVAADDGVMPQTEEHLDIVRLLGVTRAVFVITKIDLVPRSRVVEVEDEIRILVSGTALEGSPVVPFSFVTGAGLEELRVELMRVLRLDGPRRADGYFRLPVDRVFVLQGHGVIVTGTALSGEIRAGDHVRCLPGEQVFRVRSLQVHNEPVDVATRGQRIAINLVGVERYSIERGQVIGDERITLMSDRFDATLEVRRTGKVRVRNHQRVRVHLGTTERLATVILLGGDESIGPGESAFCQIVLHEPVPALRGDHFVIRNETAERTLGGGRVLHPWAHRHKRKEAGLAQRLNLLVGQDDRALIEAFLDESDHWAVALPPIAQFLNQREEAVAAVLAGFGGVRVLSLEGEPLVRES
jgi:selenocysteine-specific elongation factor